NQYIGDRDENNVQTMGVYLKWDLFNNDSYGRVAEAKKKIISMKQKYSYAAKKESSYKKSLESALIALKKNDKTLKQTLNLLDEQTKISFKLFKRGKLSGIQMAQILNQKIDLIEQNILLEEKLITTTAQNYQLYN
ncbi:MAG: hypothetical protein HON90_14755, partial [Halobacteriovoraceae bacterium]|nr:hypothetical protein [Halobacteriovoraceae bacterium]